MTHSYCFILPTRGDQLQHLYLNISSPPDVDRNQVYTNFLLRITQLITEGFSCIHVPWK